MNMRFAWILLVLVSMIGVAEAARELSDDQKMEVCDQVASYLDHDQEEAGWEDEACLASSFKVTDEDESQVVIQFEGSLVANGRRVRCELISEKPLDDLAPAVEDCEDLE